MLAILVCDCPGAENMARGTLQEGGVLNWMEVPVYVGEEKIQQFLDSLPSTLDGQIGRETIIPMVKNSSSYALVVGYTSRVIYWENVAENDLQSQVRGRTIAEKFANV